MTILLPWVLTHNCWQNNTRILNEGMIWWSVCGSGTLKSPYGVVLEIYYEIIKRWFFYQRISLQLSFVCFVWWKYLYLNKYIRKKIKPPALLIQSATCTCFENKECNNPHAHGLIIISFSVYLNILCHVFEWINWLNKNIFLQVGAIILLCWNKHTCHNHYMAWQMPGENGA